MILIVSIIIFIIFFSIGINKYKNITKNKINFKINKEIYLNLVSQANIDIFLHDASNILNNIQSMESIDSNTKNELMNIYCFYKDLLDKFKNIDPPEEFEKNTEYLISCMKICIENLEKILFSKDKLNIKENTISFMKNNEYLIKSLQQINLNQSK